MAIPARTSSAGRSPSSGCSRSRRPPTTSPPTASTCSGRARTSRPSSWSAHALLSDRDHRGPGPAGHGGGKDPGAAASGLAQAWSTAMGAVWPAVLRLRHLAPVRAAATGHRSAGIRATDPTVPRASFSASFGLVLRQAADRRAAHVPAALPLRRGPARQDDLTLPAGPRASGGLALTTTEVGFIYGTIGTIALTFGGILGGSWSSRDGL